MGETEEDSGDEAICFCVVRTVSCICRRLRVGEEDEHLGLY